MSERQPIFNAPGVVLALLGAFLLVFLALDPTWGLLPDALRERWLVLLAFFPERLGEAGGSLPGGRLAAASQFITHIFVHGDPTHLAINAAWLLAMGTPVARRLGVVRFLAFFLLCGIGGAVLFAAFNDAPMVGASGAISGLMGGVLRFLFGPHADSSPSDGPNDGPNDGSDGSAAPHGDKIVRGGLLSLRDTLTDRRILIGIGAWTVLNIAAAVALPAVLGGVGIAWEAHLGGFFTGLLTFGLFDPPAPSSD